MTDFRNHAGLALRLDPAPVCLFGANGAGKTNILEALATLAPGRGLRGADLLDMARGGAEAAVGRPRAWAVAASLVVEGEAVAIGAGAEPGPDGAFRRVARRDGRPAAAADLAETVRFLWATPAMDRLFAGPAGDRRRFLDRFAAARAPGHGPAAAAYERALRERSRLLAGPRPDPAWLSALEREMAAHGAAVAAARAVCLQRLQIAIDARPDGAFPKARLALQGRLEEAFVAGAVSADVEDEFIALLRESRARDAAAGRALEGPHRADLAVRHQGKDMPAALCSTGEQKALLIGLILAQAAALAGDPGAGPALLLLDEAGAHLDAERRAALFAELLNGPGQAWLTGTDRNLFEALEGCGQMIAIGA